MPSRDFIFRYLGDSKSLAKASGRAERALGGVDQKSRKVGKGLGIMRGGVAKLGLALGGAALIGGAAKAIGRAEEMNSAYAATEQIIRTTGGAANVTGGQLKELATKTSILTGVDKDLIIEGQNILLTFKNIREEVGEGNDIFSRAQDVMLDFSAVMKTDAKSGALQLGKALNDPIKGLTALGRVGVQFTDVQKEQIRNFQESGDIMGAQKVILRELEGQVGGVAAATADSTAKISNSWKEVQEQIGNILLPAIDALVPAMQAVGREAPAATRKIGLGFSFAKKSLGGMLDLADIAAGPFINLGDAWSDQEEVLFKVNKRMVQYTESLAAGGDESNLFVSLLADLIDKGDFTIGTLKAMKEATGISGDEFKKAALQALAMKDELGITEEAADLLKRELKKLEFGTSDMSTAAGDTLGPLEDMAEGEDDAAGAADRLKVAVDGVAKKMKELLDPVFKAEQATDKFEETLERVQEDAILTQDELEELTGDLADMQAANEAVTPENLEAYSQKSREALGLLDESTGITAGNLEGLAQSGGADLARLVGAAGELLDKKLIVELRATIPSRAEMDAAVRAALQRARRRGIDGINF